VMIGQDRHGKRIKVSGTGLLARAIQHEFDHLQGELYIDGLPPGEEIIPVSELHADDDDDDDEELATSA
jgi:peptide deformylase